jgi:hypothetical protein
MFIQNKAFLVSKKLLPALIFLSIFLLTIGLLYFLVFVNTQRVLEDSIRITSEGVVEGTDKICRNGNVYTLTEDIAGVVEDKFVRVVT